MPILREETSIYPDILLNELPRGPAPRRWSVLYTTARQEKAVARELLAHQIPFYLPLIKKTTVARGRRRTSFAPLFGGYVFLYGAEEERIRSLTTNRILQILSVDDPDQLVYDLRQIRQLIAANVPLTLESRMGPGPGVRVR